jgi:hypothetical protein
VHSSGSGYGEVAGWCKHDDEFSSCTKGGNFLTNCKTLPSLGLRSLRVYLYSSPTNTRAVTSTFNELDA